MTNRIIFSYDFAEEYRKSLDEYIEKALGVVSVSGLYDSQVSNYQKSSASIVKLKVTLSRPLTWSEREYLRVQFLDTFRKSEHRFLTQDIFTLEVDAETVDDPSRSVAWELHEFLAARFFNVHIRAVQTITPKVKV